MNKIENGKNFNMFTFTQVLRSLNQLQNLEVFKTQTQISPLQLAKIELKKPKRASRKKQHLTKTKIRLVWLMLHS